MDATPEQYTPKQYTPKNPPAATSSPNSQSKKPVIILDRSPDRINDIRINDFNIATLYGLGRCFIPSSYIYKYRKGNYVIRINKFIINDVLVISNNCGDLM